MNQRGFNHIHPHNTRSLQKDPHMGAAVKNMGVHQAQENSETPNQRNERAQDFQISKSQAKGKEHMSTDPEEPKFWPCLIVLGQAFQKLFAKARSFASVVTRRAMCTDIAKPGGEYQRRKS
jgi:hypothetical protein